MRTVIVTAIGSFSTDIVIKECKENGIRVTGCDVYPRGWITDAGNVEAFYQVPYAADMGHYIGTMMSLYREKGVETVIPLTDAEIDVFDLRQDEFGEVSITLYMSNKARIDLYRDKMELYRCLGEHMGRTVIPILRLGDTGPDEIRYPAVCKPYNGRSNQGLKMVGSRREMKGVLGETDPTDYIVQSMIRGDMVTVDVMRGPEQGTRAAVYRRELSRTPNGAGTSVLVFRNHQLEEHCRAIAGLLGIRECVSMEFIEDRGGICHVLGYNPRFSGDVEFSCLAGYDCVTNHLRCFEGKGIERDDSVAGTHITRKYGEYITKVERWEGVTGYERQSARQRRAASRRYNYNGQHQLCCV